MRTVVLSLGLALLCLLRAEAGAAGPDRSKVTCSTPGREAWSLVTRVGAGAVFRGWGWLGMLQPLLALLSMSTGHTGVGSYPAPAEGSSRDAAGAQMGCRCHGLGAVGACRCPGHLSPKKGQVLPGSLDLQPIYAARLQGNGTSLLWPPTLNSTSVRRIG